MEGYRPLIVVWLALLLLLASTVTASFLLTGAASLATGLGIAITKAALVYWFFMRLRSERGLLRLAAGAGFAWLLILLFLLSLDYVTRH